MKFQLIAVALAVSTRVKQAQGDGHVDGEPFVAINEESYPLDGVGTIDDPQDETAGIGAPLLYTRGGKAFGDGLGSPAGDGRPSARRVMQELYLNSPLVRTSGSKARAMSHAFSYFGIFLAQELYNPAAGDPVEFFPIPCDDGVMDMQCLPDQCTGTGEPSTGGVPYSRTNAVVGPDGVRGPVNAATAWTDLGSVYGHDRATTDSLLAPLDPSNPTGPRSAKMLLTENGLPEFVDGRWLIADQRRAELLGTLALHTLLLREHNRFVDVLRDSRLAAWEVSEELDPPGCSPPCSEWTEWDLFVAARMWTTSVFQHIIEDEYMPLLLGKENSPVEAPEAPWSGASAQIEAFAAVAMSFSYSTVTPTDRIINKDYQPLGNDDPLPIHLGMQAAIQRRVLTTWGLGAVMRGMVFQGSLEVDAGHTEELTSFMHAAPTANVQLGRDLGLPSYNAVREAYNLPAVASFEDLTGETLVAAKLDDLYPGGIDDLDAIVGAMLEVHDEDSYPLPPLLRKALSDQLTRNMVADERWQDSHNLLTDAEGTTLADVIRLNPDPGTESDAEYATLTNAAFYRQPYMAGLSVRAAEQEARLADDRYILQWELKDPADPALAKIEVTARFFNMGPAGYFAFGLGPDMSEADIVAFIAFSPNSDVPMLEDRTSRGNQLPTRDAEQNTELEFFSMDAENNMVTARFSRLLNTGDPDDIVIIPDEVTQCIWSFNPAQNNVQHGRDTRGRLGINFRDGTVKDLGSSESGFFVLHGIVNMLAWGIAGPLAFFVARYCKGHSYWLELHGALALFAAETCIPLAFSAIATEGDFETTHGKIGLSLLILVVLQALSGVIRGKGIENKWNRLFGSNYERWHQYNKRLHRWLGRPILVLGIVNVYYGLHAFGDRDTTLNLEGTDQDGGDTVSLELDIFSPLRNYVMHAWVALLGVAFVAAEINLWRKIALAERATAEQLSLKTLTMEEFNDKVLQGEKWVIVNEMVVDIAGYAKVHPGGSKIIKESIGTDITREIKGLRKLVQGVFREAHKHSGNAYSVINANVVAFVDKRREEQPGIDPEKLVASGKGVAVIGDASLRQIPIPPTPRRGSSSRRRKAFGDEQLFLRFELIKKRPLSQKHRFWSNGLVWEFVFSPLGEGLQIQPLRPGHFYKFRVVHKGVVIQRSYTPIKCINITSRRQALVFYIRLSRMGAMAGYLSQVKLGESVRMQGPSELKQVDKYYRQLNMVAAGTGVTPMLQLIRSKFDKSWEDEHSVAPPDSMVLLWQTHDDYDVFCQDDLTELARLAADGQAKCSATFQFVVACNRFTTDQFFVTSQGQKRSTLQDHYNAKGQLRGRNVAHSRDSVKRNSLAAEIFGGLPGPRSQRSAGGGDDVTMSGRESFGSKVRNRFFRAQADTSLEDMSQEDSSKSAKEPSGLARFTAFCGGFLGMKPSASGDATVTDPAAEGHEGFGGDDDESHTTAGQVFAAISPMKGKRKTSLQLSSPVKSPLMSPVKLISPLKQRPRPSVDSVGLLSSSWEDDPDKDTAEEEKQVEEARNEQSLNSAAFVDLEARNDGPECNYMVEGKIDRAILEEALAARSATPARSSNAGANAVRSLVHSPKRSLAARAASRLARAVGSPRNSSGAPSIASELADETESLTIVSGPPGFADHVEKLLIHDMGVPESQVLFLD